MFTKRKVEVFSAGCAVCVEVVSMIKSLACPSCEIQVLDMQRPEIAKKAKQYGIKSVPAVVINGKLADCCGENGPSEAVLRSAGLGQTIV